MASNSGRIGAGIPGVSPASLSSVETGDGPSGSWRPFMIDWGAYVIVASIIWSDGETSDYHPSTRFDQVSCLKTAMRINAEWRANGIIGFATCNLADPDGGPKASSGENYRTN